MKEKIIGIASIAVILLVGVYVGKVMSPSVSKFNLGGSFTDTFNTGVTNSTATINTTATQVFASVTRWATIINPTANQITCSLDDQGTTVASSTVGANKGIVIAPLGSSSTLPSSVQFGNCSEGAFNCIPFNG